MKLIGIEEHYLTAEVRNPWDAMGWQAIMGLPLTSTMRTDIMHHGTVEVSARPAANCFPSGPLAVMVIRKQTLQTLAEEHMMPHEQVAIRTCDGDCPSHVMIPAGGEPWPAVIFYMDAGGVRPTELDMAQRLAEAGYVVLLPDLFYRYGPYGPFVPKEVFAGDVRGILGPLMATTGNDKAAEDTEAWLAYLDTRRDVAGCKVGAVGFCMGGGMALAAAGTYPDRFAAVASFHGGNLATDAPTSPHLFAPKIKAEVYVAAAENDGSYTPEMAERLEKTLAQAGIRFNTETYPAAHGWMKPDFPVYNHAAAERGWVEMLALFDRNLHHGE